MSLLDLDSGDDEQAAIRQIANAIKICERLGQLTATCHLQLGLDTLIEKNTTNCKNITITIQ